MQRYRAVLLLFIFLVGCSRSPESRRDRFIAKGQELFAKQEYSRALLEFRNAARVMPKDAEPYYNAGLTSLAMKDLSSAVAAFQTAVALNPNHTRSKLILAEIMTTGDRDLVEKAQKSISELLALTPSTPEMLNTLAVTHLRLGEPDQAIDILESVLAKNPGELISAILLAQSKFRANDIKGAEEALKHACDALPSSPEARIALAQLYVRERRLPEAQASLQSALSLNPRSAAALRELGAVQDMAGLKREAEQTFKRFSELGPESYKPALGLYLMWSGRRDEAVREFERVYSQNPENRAARTMLAAAYQATNRGDQALSMLDTVIRKHPGDLDALLSRAPMLIAAGKLSEAESDINKVLKFDANSAPALYQLAKIQQRRGEKERSRATLSRVLEQHPTLLGVRIELAGLLIEDKNPRAALSLLDQAPGPDKEALPWIEQRNWALWADGRTREMRAALDGALARSRTPELLIQDGLLKLQAGAPDAARASLEQALEVNPGDIRGLTALKQSYLAQRKGAMAVQRVREFAARQPHSAPVQEFLGYTLWASGDRASARSAFQAAAAADSKYTPARLSLVQLAAMDSNWNAAAGELNALVTANPRNAVAQLWLGNVESIRGNSATALDHFRMAVDADPNNAQALNNLAYLLAEGGGDMEQALQYAQRAVEANPSDPNYADTLGWILYRKGLYASAVRHLERAAAAGRDVVAKYHLAMAYAKSGSRDRGRIVYAEALARNPNLPEASRAKELLMAK